MSVKTEFGDYKEKNAMFFRIFSYFLILATTLVVIVTAFSLCVYLENNEKLQVDIKVEGFLIDSGYIVNNTTGICYNHQSKSFFVSTNNDYVHNYGEYFNNYDYEDGKNMFPFLNVPLEALGITNILDISCSTLDTFYFVTGNTTKIYKITKNNDRMSYNVYPIRTSDNKENLNFTGVIAIDKYIYVTIENIIHKYDTNGVLKDYFVADENLELSGITYDDKAKLLYVVSSNDNSLLIYSLDGEYYGKVNFNNIVFNNIQGVTISQHDYLDYSQVTVIDISGKYAVYKMIYE